MLRVRDLSLRYRTERGEVDAVRGVSFTVEQGKFFTLLGPSGCGKSSTLRCIAGLETPTGGTIEIGPTTVFSSASRTVVPVFRRDIGMVFQSYAIWPHMTVFDNVAFPLVRGVKRVPRNVVRDKVMWALGLVQLGGYADRPAPFLSGGQQQRVALARALVREPTVLLLDEPLSNLDAKLRETMRLEIKNLVRRLNITTLFVTHDQLEALSMSDEVALMRDGLIVQVGPPRSVYHEPQDPFVANFLGKTNLIDGVVVHAATPGASDLGRIDTPHGSMVVPLPAAMRSGAAVTIGFRPEAVLVSGGDVPPGDNVLRGTVVSSAFAGDAVEYRVDLGATGVHARGDPLTLFGEGATVTLRVPPNRCYVLKRDGDAVGANTSADNDSSGPGGPPSTPGVGEPLTAAPTPAVAPAPR